MKVIHLIMSGSTRSGGLYNSVYGLCGGLKEYVFIQVWFGKEFGRTVEERKWKIFETKKFLKIPPYKFGYMPGLFSQLLFSRIDILHIHGVWSYNALASSILRLLNIKKTKLVVSPRGMLDEWSVGEMSIHKRIALKTYTRWLIRAADLFHALNESEKKSLIKLGINQSKIVVSANAISELPQIIRKKEINIFTLTFLGRIHKKKGIENLLFAIKEIKGEIQLLIAGWGDSDYVENLKLLCKELEIENKVSFLGPMFDAQKDELLCRSNAFILPSYSEGLPMAVLEALSYGMPVIITDNCNLTELRNEIFYFPIQTDPQSIKDSIIDVMQLTRSEYDKISYKAREVVASRYSWKSEVSKIYKGYKQITYTPNE